MVFSVIMPVYNKAPYLEGAVESVLKQAHLKELIAIDDGSTDGSGAILNRLAEGDSRIKVIHQENAGVSAARNCGIEHISGDYVCFLDGDDLLEDGFLEKAYKEIWEKKPDMAFFSYKKRLTDGRDLLFEAPCKGFCHKKAALEALYKVQGQTGFFGIVTNKLTASHVIKSIRFDTELKLAEDLDFWIKAMTVTESCYFSPTPSFIYAQDVPGSSAFDRTDYFAQLKIRQRYKSMLENELPGLDIEDAFREVSRFIYFTLFSACLKGGKNGRKVLEAIWALGIKRKEIVTAGAPGFHRLCLGLVKHRLGGVAVLVIRAKQRLKGQKDV